MFPYITRILPGATITLQELELCRHLYRTSLVAQTVKRLPAVRETWVQSLGGEDSPEKEMATHSSTLAWKIPRMEEPAAGCCPRGCKELDTTERLPFTGHLYSFLTGLC